jgi:hypothetical protein
MILFNRYTGLIKLGKVKVFQMTEIVCCLMKFSINIISSDVIFLS